MPTWGMHLLTAKKISEKVDVDSNLFLFGNILPDINNGYVIPEVSCIIPHKITHHAILGTIQGKKEYLSGSEIFFEKYRENLKNPMVLGYLTHLLLDSYWNAKTYIEYGIRNEKEERIGIRLNTGKKLICDGEQARIIKTNDFKIFSEYIYQNQLVDAPFYTKEIPEATKEIEEINLSDQDIRRTIQYIDDNVKGKIQVQKDLKELKIYTEKDLIKNVDESIEYIMDFLKV